MKKITSNLANELNHYKKLLKESYVFDNNDPSEYEEQPYFEDDENDYDERPMRNQEETEENVPLEMDDNEVVNKIRSLALKGIQKYSEEVTSPLYEFFKKIWAECDKLITDAAKKQEIGGKGK